MNLLKLKQVNFENLELYCVLESYVICSLLHLQIGVMYGCGQWENCFKKYHNNTVTVPNSTFPVEYDPTRYVCTPVDSSVVLVNTNILRVFVTQL